MIVQTAIYLTLGLAGKLAITLQENGLAAISFISALLLVAVAITLLSVSKQRGKLMIGSMIGVVAVYWITSVRILALEERTHLFEYSLVAALVFQALVERKKQGRKVPAPALLAIVLTSVLGLIDEGIQYLMPARFFDIRDVGFNSLAALIAVGLGLVLSKIDNWINHRNL